MTVTQPSGSRRPVDPALAATYALVQTRYPDFDFPPASDSDFDSEDEDSLVDESLPEEENKRIDAMLMAEALEPLVKIHELMHDLSAARALVAEKASKSGAQEGVASKDETE